MTNLKIGESYTVSVKSRNSVGQSPSSAPLQVVFANAPDAPAAPSTVNEGDRVVIRFSAPANDNGANIEGYDVLINTHYDHQWDTTRDCDLKEVDSGFECSVPVDTLMARPFNLQPGDVVLVKVIAYNRIGESEESAEGGSAKIMTAPDAPTFVATSLVQNGDFLHVSFIVPSFNGGSPITGYKIFIKEAESEDYFEAQATQVSDGSFDVDAVLLKNDPFHLRDGSDVFAKVVAINQVGETESEPGHGAIYEIPCLTGVAPDAPVDLQESTTTGTSITFDWFDAKCTGGAEIRTHIVSYQEQGEQAEPDQIYAGEQNTYTIQFLKPATKYEIRIASQSALGRSPQSKALIVKTPAAVPSVIRDLKVSDRTDYTVSLEWSAPANNGAAIMLYSIHWERLNEDTQLYEIEDPVIVFDTEVTLTRAAHGVQPDSFYRFTVEAANMIG